MKIVGSNLSMHDQGFSLIENNEIIACYSEERFSRIKPCYNWYNFPTYSYNEIQKDFNINIKDIKDKSIDFVSAKPINTNLSEVIDILKFKPIKLYNHHYCHACGTYYTSGFDDDTLVISYDGGDGSEDNFTELNLNNLHLYVPFKILAKATYASCYIVKNGRLIELEEKIHNGSLAKFWYSFCDVFGFVGLKDEGKIMGLAAQGEFDQKIYNQLKFFADNNCYLANPILDNYYKNLINSLPLEKSLILKRNLAYTLQYFTETYMLEYINNINNKYGPFKNLCVAGGIFANVKLNQKINEYLSFQNMWVYPAMGDEGLSLGSAIAHGVEIGEFSNRRIDNVFFGKRYNEDKIDSYLLDYDLKSQPLDYEVIADILISGKVISIFDGASEYGPRALGNRSIMVEPTKKETHEYINMRLKRDEIMPFAPIILEEHIDSVCHYYKSKHASEFMTMCYNVKPEWLDRIPAVINIYDGTARPQIVNKDRHKHFHNILTKYYEKTGIPVLMNTSFNGHGEPIINSPREALEHLSKGTIDYLIINNKIYNI